MKRALFFSLCLLIGNNHSIVLQSSVLKSLDGVWPAFDGDTILKIVHLKSKYTDMNLGKLDAKTKERRGMYTFRGQQLSIARLAELEKQHAGDQQINNELQAILSKVKADFIKLNEEFIKQVQGFKDMVLTLMRESCNKRNIAHSFMLSWADTQAGQETESFRRNMTSFQQLNRFLNDLDGFLKDLYDSCPKGRKQFFAILRQQKERGKK